MTKSYFIGAASAMALLLTPALTAAHETDKDEGPRTEASFDFTGFDRISVEGVYEVEIEVGPAYSIELSGSEKRMADIEVRKSRDTLILGTKNNRKIRGKNNGVLAVVTLPSLNEINLEGVGSIEAVGIDSDDFKVLLEGVGSIELSGTCGELDASVEGVGSLDASGLECSDVEVDVDGMGSAEVYASSSVDADINGMGSIDVEGSPKDIKKSKSFMSSIDVR